MILGDGPVLIGMFKQSHISIFYKANEIKLLNLVQEKYSDAVDTFEDEKGKHEYLDIDYFRDNEVKLVTTIHDHKLEIFWVYDDNYYIYVRLTQPDGNVWTGFSG